jgi:hypothetical protein
MNTDKPRNTFGSSITFDDGFTVSIGQNITFNTRHGSVGTGVVMGFQRVGKRVSILVEANKETTDWSHFDRWPLRDGGFYDRLREQGLAGGEIYR